MSVHIVFCTCPDRRTAQQLADRLVGERLAACASIGPELVSTYHWQGAVETSEEIQLVLKTASTRLQALIARINALHPYELPEILAVEASAGLPAYLAWVVAETHEDPSQP